MNERGILHYTTTYTLGSGLFVIFSLWRLKSYQSFAFRKDFDIVSVKERFIWSCNFALYEKRKKQTFITGILILSEREKKGVKTSPKSQVSLQFLT